MNTTLFGLQVEYEDYSIEQFCLVKDEGIHRHELSRLQLRMLEENVIPHVLQLDVEEHNLLINLRYSYQGKRPLFHILKSKKLENYDYLHLLFQILTTLCEVSNYMLDERCFVLDEKFIFVDRETMIVYLTYIPIKDVPQEQNVKEQLIVLIQMLFGYLDVPKKMVEDLITDFLHDKSNIKSLRQQIKELINSMYSDTEYNNNDLSTWDQDKEEHQHQPPQQAHHVDQDLVKQQGPDQVEETSADLPRLTSRAKTYLYLSAIVLVAVIWRGYLEYQMEGMLYVCIGLSLLIFNGVVVFQFLWRPKLLLTKSSHPITEEQSTPNVQEKKSPKIKTNKTLTSAANEKSNKNSTLNIESYYKQLSKHTQLLKPTLETSLLPQDIFSDDTELNAINNEHNKEVNHRPQTRNLKNLNEVDQEALAFLVKKDQTNIINIKRVPFIVGRSPEMVDYVESRLGVSRTHFEINIHDNEFIIIDLGSRNGTYLNGKRLSMNIPHRLNEADILQIASVEMVFNFHQ